MCGSAERLRPPIARRFASAKFLPEPQARPKRQSVCGNFLRAAPGTPQFLALATPATAVVYSDASWANLNLNRLGKGGDWNYKKRRRRPDGLCIPLNITDPPS
jgi:hypothetical protein